MTIVWAAFRAPACWALGAGLTIFVVAGSYAGHGVDLALLPLIGGLLGVPFLFEKK